MERIQGQRHVFIESRIAIRVRCLFWVGNGEDVDRDWGDRSRIIGAAVDTIFWDSEQAGGGDAMQSSGSARVSRYSQSI
jgi:hypothetical protein